MLKNVAIPLMLAATEAEAQKGMKDMIKDAMDAQRHCQDVVWQGCRHAAYALFHNCISLSSASPSNKLSMLHPVFEAIATDWQSLAIKLGSFTHNTQATAVHNLLTSIVKNALPLYCPREELPA